MTCDEKAAEILRDEAFDSHADYWRLRVKITRALQEARFPTPAVPATPEGPDDPAHWHLCRHDILKRDCVDCRSAALSDAYLAAAVPATPVTTCETCNCSTWPGADRPAHAPACPHYNTSSTGAAAPATPEGPDAIDRARSLVSYLTRDQHAPPRTSTFDPGAAVPATTPVCAAWCGTWRKRIPKDCDQWFVDGQGNHHCFCSTPCQNLASPRNPPPTQTPDTKGTP